MNIKERAKSILKELNLKQKANLLYGKNFWYVEGKQVSGELGDIMFSDGPHGLRKQASGGDMIGINASVPATVFPSAAASASSWDTELLQEFGAALGKECISQGVDVLLGPAVNHKRDPRCGRNFEYFSEDPYLTGKLGAAYVRGIQSMGVGACPKHFAANSREYARMYSDSIVDERTLREIYLRQFEIIVKESQPYAIMTAYNKLNGTYCSENEKLLNGIARGEWGFEGIFLTDWGAMSNQIESYKAGLDLEMPGTFGSDDDIVRAVESGEISEDIIDEHAQRIIELILKTKSKDTVRCDISENFAVAQKIAERSAVLLKNENILPITEKSSVAVIGAFAKEPRYQGTGSSRINPIAADCPYDELKELYAVTYAQGYGADDLEPNSEYIDDAVKAAKSCDYAVVFAGLPPISESEGYDRKTIDMPRSHSELIKAVARANRNTVVVLQCGSPVTMPWLSEVKGVLLAYLAGCRCGKACANILSGKVNPSGKLAETFPVCIDDVPDVKDFNVKDNYAAYTESVYTGYRWYDKKNIKPLFEFGFGLSYTEFSLDNFKFEKEGDTINVSLDIENAGKRKGGEVVQIYVSDGRIKELKAFKKVYLAAGERANLAFALDKSAFEHFNTALGSWQVKNGDYDILIGTSSEKIVYRFSAHITGGGSFENAPLFESENEFFAYIGSDVPAERTILPITSESPFKDLEYTPFGKTILQSMVSSSGGDVQDEMSRAVALEMPIRGMTMGRPMTRQSINQFVDMINCKK